MANTRVKDEEYRKVISIKGVNINDWTDNYKPKMGPGINITYYQLNGNTDSQSDKDAQAVLSFLTSNLHLDQKNNKTRDDVNQKIGQVLDKVLDSDRVRSAKDFHKALSKNNLHDKKYIIDSPLSILENTEYDSYIKRATKLVNNPNSEDKIKMARIWGNEDRK